MSIGSPFLCAFDLDCFVKLYNFIHVIHVNCVYPLQCLYELVLEAPFLYTSDLDTVISTCFRALDGSNYDVRCDVAKFMGHVTATALNPPKAHMQGKPGLFFVPIYTS